LREGLSAVGFPAFELDQEVSMQKLLPSLTVAAAFAFFASAGQACEFHAQQVSASLPSEEVVAMSSVSDATTPVVIATDQTAVATTTPECPAGQTNCVPADK
jgi:hypothetical protein